MIPIFLIGFRASGKTFLGKKVSEILNIPFYDLDHIFEERFGSISEYVEQYGWNDFRTKESILLEKHKDVQALISTGGGIVESLENRVLLTQSHTIFINTPFEFIEERLSRKKNIRPALIPNISPEDEIIQTYEKRLPWYEEVSQSQFIPTEDKEENIQALTEIIQAETGL